MHAKYINELRIAWATIPGRFQSLFVNDLDLKNTKGQNMGKRQVNVKQSNISKFKQPNISKFSLYGARMFNTSVK